MLSVQGGELRFGKIILPCVNIFGGLIFGYNSGVIAGALAPIQVEFNFFQSEMSSVLSSILQGALILGAFVGSIAGATMSNLIGRRITIITLSLLSFLGVVVSTASVHYWMLVPARALLGIGMGMTAVVCPLYVSELAKDSNRGMLGSLFQLAITCGIFLSYVAGIAFIDIESGSWRYMLGLGALPSIALFTLGCVIPESPFWLESRQQRKNQSSAAKSGQLRDMFRRESVKPLAIGLLLAIVLQLTGINAIMYYAPSILANVFPGGGSKLILSITIFIGLWNFLTTLVAVFLVDRIGRKKLYIVGLAAMTISNLALGFIFKFIPATSLAQGITAVICIAIFIAGFEIGPGPLFFVLCTELFPQKIRDSGNSLMNGVNWALTLLITLAFLPVAEVVGQAVVFWVFGGVGLVTWLILVAVLPETKGRSISTGSTTTAVSTASAPKYEVDQVQSAAPPFSSVIDKTELAPVDKDDIAVV